MAINTVTVSGTLTKNSNLIEFSSSKVYKGSIAIPGAGPRQSEGKGYELGFLEFEVWNERAELFEKLDPGTKVVLTGRIKYEKYESKDGKQMSKVLLSVTGDNLSFLSQSSEDSGSSLPSTPTSSNKDSAEEDLAGLFSD